MSTSNAASAKSRMPQAQEQYEGLKRFARLNQNKELTSADRSQVKNYRTSISGLMILDKSAALRDLFSRSVEPLVKALLTPVDERTDEMDELIQNPTQTPTHKKTATAASSFLALPNMSTSGSAGRGATATGSAGSGATATGSTVSSSVPTLAHTAAGSDKFTALTAEFDACLTEARRLSDYKNESQLAGPFKALVARTSYAVDAVCAVSKTQADLRKTYEASKLFRPILRAMAEALKQAKPANLTIQAFTNHLIDKLPKDKNLRLTQIIGSVPMPKDTEALALFELISQSANKFQANVISLGMLPPPPAAQLSASSHTPAPFSPSAVTNTNSSVNVINELQQCTMVALSLPKNDAQFAGPFEALVDRIGKAVNTFCAIPKTTDEDMERARLTMQTLTHTLQTMAKKLKEVKPTNLAVQNFVEAFVSQIGNGSTEKGIFEDALCPNNAEAINDAEVIKLVALTNSSIKLLENDVEITKERWKALQQQTAAAPMQSPMGSASAASSGLHQPSASNLPLVNPLSSAAAPMHGSMASTQPSAHLPGLSNPAHELPALPLSAAPSAAASPSVVVVHAPATASATATAAPAPVLTAKEQALETEQATSDLVAAIAFETVVFEGDNFSSEAKEIARKRIAELQEQLGKLQSK